MYPAVYMADILYQQKLFITPYGRKSICHCIYPIYKWIDPKE